MENLDNDSERVCNAIIENNIKELQQLKNGHIFCEDINDTAIGLAIREKNIKIIKKLFGRGALPVDNYNENYPDREPEYRPLCIHITTDADKRELEIIEIVLKELSKDELTKKQQDNFTEHYNLDEYEKTEYIKAKESNIHYGFEKACLIGKIDIIDLFIKTEAVIDVSNKDFAIDVFETIINEIDIQEHPQLPHSDERRNYQTAHYKKLVDVLEHIVPIFIKNGLGIEDIEKRKELIDNDYMKEIIEDEKNKIVIKLLPEINRKMRKSTKKNVDPYFSQFMGSFIRKTRKKTEGGNRKPKKSRKCNKSKTKRSKTRKR